MSARDTKRHDVDGLPLYDTFLDELAALERERDPELAALGVDRERSAAPAGAEAIALGLSALAESLTPLPVSAAARARLLAAATPAQRFERFVPQVAGLLDVSVEAAERLLARIDDAAGWTTDNELPGIAFMWIEAGPRLANAVRGFVRVDAGVEFPQHEHLGEERVFVLQGGFEDSARGLAFRAGETDVMPAGSSHSYRALPDGPHLVGLAIMEVGICVLGRTYLAQAPATDATDATDAPDK